MKRILRILPFLFLLTFCKTKKENEEPYNFTVNELNYAKNFSFEKTDSTNFLVVKEYGNEADAPAIGKFTLKKPFKRIVCTSTTHLPFIEMLGAEDALVGFANTHYITSENFSQRVADGKLTEVGADEGLNIELIASLQPDAVVTFDTDKENANLKKIQEMGIPVIYNTDYLEISPLGRAEWIKFFGTLLGKQQEANQIFDNIVTKYDSLKNITKNVEKRPTIMTGMIYGGAWFLPGGQNWSAIFFDDAGGEYLWKSDSTSGSLSLSFESVYVAANQANYWIGTGNFSTKEGLLAQDGRYASFKAFHDGHLYNFHKKQGKDGGYDYFESGFARPDIILSDLIKILHPELLPNYETVYYDQLK